MLMVWTNRRAAMTAENFVVSWLTPGGGAILRSVEFQKVRTVGPLFRNEVESTINADYNEIDR